MSYRILKWVALIFLTAIFFNQVVMADAPSITNSGALGSTNNLVDNQGTNNPLSAAQTLGFGNPSFSWGPLSVGAEYDSLLGAIFNAQYIQKIRSSWATGLLAEYGPNQYRFNGTLGYQIGHNNQIKVSGEYLSQVLPFSFDSGNIEQRVGQEAYGVELRHNFQSHFFQDINMSGYWSRAPNVGLASIVFLQNDLYYTNQRNIAGATTGGADVGMDMALTRVTSLGAKLFYDNATYDTVLTSNSGDNTAGMGGSLTLSQVITNRMKLDVTGEIRSIYDKYDAEFSWTPKFAKVMNFSLYGERLVSSNATPSSDAIGIEINVLLDEDAQSPDYHLSNPGSFASLTDWVKTPAIYMPRVLAIAEQETTLNAPTVLSLQPSTGPFVGGNTIIITGTNFLPGITVTFGGLPGVVTLLSTTELSVVVPELSSSMQANKTSDTTTQAVEVIVSNSDGQHSTFSGVYTYTTAFAPAITNITPSNGVDAGGTSVTITGAQLTGATAVTFGGVAATSFTVDSSTQITAITPVHAAGAVDVAVTSSGGIGTLTDGYTYSVSAPVITSISPSDGSTAGGTAVTLTGIHFTGATAVNFGSTVATSFTIDSPTSITAISPAGSAGTVNITVTTPNGTSSTSSEDEFTYNAPPTVTGISPSSGYTTGDTSVTITGEHFTGTTAVNFGSTASSFSVDSDTSITATSPASSAGTIDITVTTSNGTSGTSFADQFTYNTPPHIIFVTTTTYNGNLGGFSGADSKCNSSGSGKPMNGFAKDYTYKALLSGNNATTSGVSYYRADGTTLIAIANSGNLVGASSLADSISGTSLNAVWTGASSTCANWTSSSSGFGTNGIANSTSSNYWSNGAVTCSASNRNLYCVSQ